MSTPSGDLGVIGNLVEALGLTSGGNFRDDWLADPGRYLGRMLANPQQRDALIAFVDEVLGGAERSTGPDGSVWLPIAQATDPSVTVYLVIDDRDANGVAIGLGLKVSTTTPQAAVSAHVPLFQAAKEGRSVASPVLLGTPAGRASVTVDITTDASAPVAGQARLGGIVLALTVPTDGTAPSFGLTLRGLQLPGAPSSRDLSLSVADLASLQSSALELVLGLARAQASALPAGPLAALAGLIGLREGSAVPPLPLHQLLDQGLPALAQWFGGLLQPGGARTAWLNELKSLLGVTAAVEGGERVTLPLGPLRLSLSVPAAPGATGLVRIRPTVAIEWRAQPGVWLRGEAVLCSLDLGTGQAVALPSLNLGLVVGQAAGGAVLLDVAGPPALRVASLRAGFGLDAARKPTLLLAADGVSIGGHAHDTLDLSSPDAIAQVGTTVFNDVADEVLDRLGPAADAVRLLLGLAPPTVVPALVPALVPLQLGTFLQDPVAAIRGYWLQLVQHPDPQAMRSVLTQLRDLVADAGSAALGITGTGAPDAPWQLTLVGPVVLRAWVQGSRLHIGPALRFAVDDIGQRCTRIETALAVTLVEADLAQPGATFLSSIDLSLKLRARGRDEAVIDIGPYRLQAEHVALAGRWSPTGGLRVGLQAPSLVLDLGEGIDPLPVPLPTLNDAGRVVLDDAGWSALENLLAALARAAAPPWLDDLVALLGWQAPAPGMALRPARLSLKALSIDAAAALRAWLRDVLASDAEVLPHAFSALATLFTGARNGVRGLLQGSGTPLDPWRVALSRGDGAVQGSAELVAWLGPDGPKLGPGRLAGAAQMLGVWRTGSDGLMPAELARSLLGMAGAAPDLAALLAGRDRLADGLDALMQRWMGSDGCVLPPAEAPAGITVHRLPGVLQADLVHAVDLEALLGTAPATVLHIAVTAPDALPWPDIPADRLIDLTAPDRLAASFALPAAATGEWYVALGGRIACATAGDADGVQGQADRLARILGAFASLGGGLALVSDAAAGHAARRAADAIGAVTALVTAGTPLGPVSLQVLDTAPAGDTLRLLQRLLPPLTSDAELDTSEPADLHRARGLIEALARHAHDDDPARELRPPAGAPATVRAGLAVHMLFGEVDAPSIRRALTALVTAALTRRTGLALAAGAEPDRLVIGLRAGLAAGAATPGGLTVDGHAELQLAQLRLTDSGLALDTPRDLSLHVALGRSGGWLVGGPDPGRSAGAPRPHELRRAVLDLRLPLGNGGATPHAAITLLDARVFELSHERWRLQAADLALPSPREGFDAASTLLPEARVLLSSLAQSLAADASTAATSLAGLLRGFGLMDATSGSVPDAIEHLLNDPLAHARSAWQDNTKRAQLIAALRGLWPVLPEAAPDELAVSAGPLSARLALSAQWQLDVRAQADAGVEGGGWIGWQGHLVFNATGVVDGGVSLGADIDGPAGITGGVQLALDRSLRLAVRWARPNLPVPEDIELWPLPQPAAIESALARLVPAELTRAALEGLRGLDDSARPTIDAALSLLGLLADADAHGLRRVRLPAGLFADPVGWLRSEAALGAAGAFTPARLVQLLDALKPFLGVTGAAGTWQFAPGIALQADAAPSGAARLALSLNSGAFTLPPAAASRLAFGGTVSLSLPANAAPQVGVDLYAGLPDNPGRSAVHVALDVGTSASLRLLLRPAVGADVPLFPNPAGLGQLAETAVTQALPLVLDAVAGLAPQAGIPGQVGTLVTRLGDAMALRSGGHFSAAALQAWAADPAAALAARLPALLDAALTQLAAAISPLLPGGATAGFSAGQLHVTAGGFALALAPSPFTLTIDGTLTGLPAIDRARIALTLDGSGLKSLALEAGPATIEAGGLVIRPMFGVVAGNAPIGGARAQLMLGLPGNRLVGGRWLIGSRFDLVLVNTGIEHTEPEQVVLGLLEAVLDLVASFVLRTDAVTQLLAKPVGTSTIEAVLRGAVLETAGPPALVAQPFDVTRLLGRLQTLAANIAAASPSITIDNALTVGLAAADLGGGAKRVGVRVSLPRPAVLLSGDVTLSLETDTRWIRSPSGTPPDGIVIGLLRVGPGAGAFAFEPGLSVNGVGLRVARNERPLLDAGGFSLGSIALHVYAALDGATKAGGAQLQLSTLAMGVAGASGGGNGVAQGLMGDAGNGPDRLAPAFSPALAVQKHGSGPVLVGLRAGDGEGPWWLSIQRGFGPVYIEQVGLGVVEENDELQKISVLLDGRVSLLGLAAAVDDLQLTYTVASDASVFDPSRWNVDLAGLAFSSDLGGLTLQGGLRKFTTGSDTQYVGMLMGRFAVYGLSVFGGYGQGTVNGEKFSSFFAFGAVNGPIGGPPAFFLTGIGGGLGINRLLKLPTDFSQFARYPLIAALDPAARPDPSPMDALVRLSDTFPMNRGTFWFAAGVSFTSFALVDGVAVVSVQVGDGLEVALLGLARMALPRPQVAIVSIELGLVARFSSKEGVLWVQAQLTDNSWLLYPDVRLTGGFAFVVWFAGPNRGQFVLTIGGYHPRFRREGYPDVPRLGLQWRVGPFITIKGESYFALTSEAVMAGVRVEVSARFGPAWAQVIFGADGIVFFDPFHFEVEAYAQISAGVTIDVWIGEITISISIGARILVEGPEFHGIATFSVGPVDLEVEFGDQHQPPRPLLTWGAFVQKYLEEAAPDTARVLAAVAGKGALPPGPKGAGATDTATADGSADKPFEVYAEFELMLTNAVPTRRIVMGARVIDRTPSHAIGLAPMGLAGVKTALRLSLKKAGDAATEFIEKMQSEARSTPSFPLGVWGPSQDAGNPKLPSGDVLEAMDAVRLFTVADIPAGTPPIDYHRVETGQRHPLPFVSEGSGRAQRLVASATLKAGLPAATDDDAVLAIAAQWAARGGASRTAVASLRGERAAPPRLGSLTDGLAANVPGPVAVGLPAARTKAAVNTTVQRPRVISVLSAALDEPERITPRTTVKAVPAGAVVIDPPRLADVTGATDAAIPAVLHRIAATRGTMQGKTVVAADAAALTRIARAPLAAVRGRGAVREVQERIAALNGALMRKPNQRGAIPPGATVAAGEVVLMALPNAARDLDEQAPRPRLMITGSTARVVVLRHGGEVMLDIEAAPAQPLPLPIGAERIAVAVGLPAAAQRPGLSGWQAGSQLPALGWNTALAAQATVHCEGQARLVRERGLRRESGWIRAADLVAGTALVHTRFARPVSLVAVALDDPAGTVAGRGLSLSLQGATRARAADGSEQPPVIVVRGQRVLLVYALVPDAHATAVDVAVASEDGWHLVGVVAPMAGVALDAFATDLAQRSLDALVRTPVPAGTAQATLGWAPAPSGQKQSEGVA